MHIVKTDEAGNELWTGHFDDINISEWGGSVRQTSDGGYIIIGRTNASDAENYDIYLIKTDENGEVK